MKLTVVFIAASLSAQQPSQDALLRWMNKIAQEQLEARENAVAQVRTVADAERRKHVVRAKILEALGGLPDYAGPLNARVTGQIQADGYVIEKVIYESLPGYYVTANLYRPNQPGRYPGVLLQSGHTQEGKAEPQRLGANLALKGFVSLAFDPAGQGEREQTYDPQLKAPAAGWSVNEHLHATAQSSLVGEGVARYFIWDAKRSIDYLVSRPEVDPERLGAAGCSGGGALTTFIGGLDARLKVVIPACFPNSYRLMFTSGSNFNSEMTLPQHISRGLDTADFVELSAPAPWLLQATEHDYFTPPGAKLVYDEARRWYKLYDAEDKIAFFVGPGPHGTPLVSRERVYEWLIRWLKQGQGDFHEQPVKTYPNHELLVTRTGRVDDEPGSRKLNQLILDTFHATRKQGTPAELRAELYSLRIPTDGSAPAVKMLDESGDGLRIQHIRFESEPGIDIDARLYVPPGPGRKPGVLLLAGRLSDQLAERFARAGRVVLKLEPRHSTAPDDRRPYMGDWITNTRADQIGRNLPAMRAHDILRGVDLLCARSDVDASSIRAAAQGVRGVWLLLAAAADPRIRKVWLDKTPHSLLEALENTLNTNLFDAVIHGFALHWDLEDLTKAMGNRPVMWTDPTNWMGRVVAVGPRFQYRWVLGDLTEMGDAQDNEYAQELMK